MKKIMIAMIMMVLVLGGCYIEYYDYEDPLSKIQVGELNNYSFIEDESFNSKEEIINWVFNNIQYKSESIDYWQLPEETYNLQAGDCEDSAILAMYFLKIKLSIETEFILISHENLSHALFYILDTNEYVDVSSKTVFTVMMDGWRINHRIPYSNTMWMTSYYHNNVGIYY